MSKVGSHSLSLLRLSILLAFGSMSACAWAGATTDGTVGAVQNLSGNFVVPQNLGTTKGGNLFHSFKKFSIESGESANFTTTTALQNVIARVTGGTASNINGLLKLSAATGSQPHFYFINPAGVIFGAGAAVDVPAGLHISTADYVKFADGNFHVDTAKASTLSAAAPEAFGFLGNNSAALEIKNGAIMSLLPQQALTLAAGDISINDATVLVPGAAVRLLAVGKNKLEAGFNGDLPKADGSLNILNGGSINATVNGNVDGNLLRIQAGQILIDAQDNRQPTGIFSNAKEGGGKSGDMLIAASQQLSIQNGGRISSSTFTTGDAGAIKIDAGAVNMNGQGRLSGIFSQTNEDSGHAGNLDINVTGKLAVLNGALVSSSTYTAGNGGNVRVSANEILLDGAEANGPSTGFLSTTNSGTGNAGNIEVSAKGKLSILNSAQISTATYSAGKGADIKLNAAELLINGNAVSTGINSISGGAGNAGNLNVNISGATSILSEGGIATSAFDTGQAGKIKFTGNSLHIDGQGLEAGIYSDAGDFRTAASFRGGNGGDIDVSVAEKLSIIAGGRISTTTYTRGNSGFIHVSAKTLDLYGNGSGIMAETIGVGNAGSIAVKASQTIQMQAGARISSATRFVGNGGSVNIDTASLDVDGKGVATGIYSDAGTQAQGNAGNVDVNVSGDLSLKDGGQISSATVSYTTGSAGAVKVNAGSIKLDGEPGNAVKGEVGNVQTLNTGIFSSANAGDEYTSRSAGNAGTVNVTGKQLQMSNAAQISSSAYAKGKAGEVNVSADKIRLDSNAIISSEAGAGSSGYTGNINIKANESLSMEQGLLSIRNAAQVSAGQLPVKTLLAVDAPEIKLQQSQITASASGNVAASDIQLSFTHRLLAKDSTISTSAFQGNGGAINIKGKGPLILERSQITTSVTGMQAGNGGIGANGGDIGVTAPALILRSGFIQANTVAKAGSGGNVNIQVDTTIASGNQLVLGGPLQKFDGSGKNLIQAAAPDGVNGVIRLSSPQVDFSASLLNLTAQAYDLGDLLTDLCRVGGGSSLSTVGRGGIMPGATSLLRP
ncbi:two-partner secretion domain-containing protein [Undibacterium umbellatum]|uniref:Filamentous hemagglutinin N-terminal domain-containing protein n=1 Tax=Undibacterium umbellatum TaxID=2762300 RepID=A0ABR6ZD77_9BURK|nr:filamentous hemagglutinin N-terminal domain-containing protein [Undibacterium umbellatum]MBC3909280.1 filamentous hemagglutinin N-terminal domain-containing protein [Undibacterium umbellatum]